MEFLASQETNGKTSLMLISLGEGSGVGGGRYGEVLGDRDWPLNKACII